MRFFGILDVTDFGNQENLSLSLLHLQPAFGLLIVSFLHTQLPTWCWRVSFSSVDCLPACCLLLSQVGLTASLLALIVERVVHAAKSKPHLINSRDIDCPLWKTVYNKARALVQMPIHSATSLLYVFFWEGIYLFTIWEGISYLRDTGL